MHVNLPLEEGDLALGDQIFKIILAPGHSPGSIGLYWPEQKSAVLRRRHFRSKRRTHRFPRRQRRPFEKSILAFSKLDLEWLLPGHMGTLHGKGNIQNNFNLIIQGMFPYI